MEYEIIKDVTDEQYERIQEEFRHSFNRDEIRMVYAGGKEIGFCTTFFIDGRLTIEYYLFSCYRGQGYGGIFVSLISDAIGSAYPEHSTLYLLIHRDNYPSLRVAQKSGYTFNYDDFEFRNMVDEDMPEQYVLSKENAYYKEHALKKVQNVSE